jgi:hypothetical protein
MKRKAICQSCQQRYVAWERVEAQVITEACVCGTPRFSVPMCTCEACKALAK